MQTAIDLLRGHNLRKTPGRIDILSEFISCNYALTHKDLETNLGNKYDRVTLYRVMAGLEECGLIHRVYDGDNTIKYALCPPDCDTEHHHDDHVHFVCTHCGKTYCLSFDLPDIKLPPQYQVKELNILAKGLCNDCHD